MYPLESTMSPSHKERAASQSHLQQDDPGGAPRITSIAIPTRDRVETVERALRSYIENAQTHGRSPSFVIVDDSGNPSMQARNRAMLASLKRTYGVPLFYAGASERAAFVEKLIQHGSLPRPVVEFALLNPGNFPSSYGASRNALLLHTVGEMTLQVDDDTICKVAKVPGESQEVILTSQPDPTQIWFFPDYETALKSAEFVEEDFLGIHERLLGKSLAGFRSNEENNELSSRIESQKTNGNHALTSAALQKFFRLHKVLGALEEMDIDFISKLEGGNGHVRVTLAGTLGHSGAGKGCFWVFRDGPSFARLTESEEKYRIFLRSDQMLRAVTRPTISTGNVCIGINLGLDNRRLLPPFLPVMRGEDSVFGNILWSCFATEYVGFLPQTVIHHSPRVQAQRSPLVWNEFAQLQTGEIFSAIITSCFFDSSYDAASHARNMESLGKFIVELGEMPFEQLQERFHSLLWFPIARFVSRQKGRLGALGSKSTYWAEDLKKCVEIIGRHLSGGSYGVPSVMPKDLVESYGDAAGRLLQDIFIRFGSLLQYWPQIVETAASLHSRGEFLAQPV